MRAWAEQLPQLLWNEDGQALTHEVYVEVEVEESGRDMGAPTGPGERRILLDLVRGRPQAWVLEGEPGAGKSTLLKMTLLDLLDARETDSGEPLPIVASVADLVACGDLARAAAQPVAAALRPLVEAAVRAGLDSGRVVLLLDGADEVDQVEAAADAIERARLATLGCALVVSGRRGLP